MEINSKTPKIVLIWICDRNEYNDGDKHNERYIYQSKKSSDLDPEQPDSFERSFAWISRTLASNRQCSAVK